MSRTCTDLRPSTSAAADISPERRIAAMVANYHRQVWRALRRLGLSDTDADDGSQQVFLIAHRRLADIAPESEQSFLLQIALRVAADFRRSRRRRHEDEDHAVPIVADTSASPEELADQRRARALLDRVLDSMPLDLRQVFVLFELEELTTPEVATVLELPRGTVASRLRRAREVFRKSLLRLSGPRPDRTQAGGKA